MMVTITAFFTSCDNRSAARGAAGGNAAEDALLAREAARHLFRLCLRHFHNAVDAFGLVNLRQVFPGPGANAGDLRTFGRLHADDLDFGTFLLQNRDTPMMVPVVPMELTKCVILPSVSRQISGPVPS
jgi:hypothetical protein